MLLPPENLSAVLVMISSKSVQICNRFYAKRVDTSVTIFEEGTPLWRLRSTKSSSPSCI